MFKKILSVILCVFILFNTVINSKAIDENNNFAENLECESAVLLDAESGAILSEKNPHIHRAPASITKIMTMLLIMEAIDNGSVSLEDKVRVSENAKIMGGSEIWLEVGEELSLNDMIKAIAVASANDGAVAVAEFLCGSEEEFVKKMNEKAKALNMENTHYMNSHGLDEDNHYTSAYDIALVTKELLKYPKILEYTGIWMDSLRNGETELVNTNRLIRFYKGCNGMKTGTTDNAGHCLCATANKNNLSLIAVILGAKTGAIRFDAATKLLDYGFSAYENITLPDTVTMAYTVPVKFGEEAFAIGKAKIGKNIVIPKSKKNSLSAKISIKSNVNAPVEKGETLGTAEIYLGDKLLGKYNIVNENYIPHKTFGKTFSKLWKGLCDF